jgi:tRNA (guanine-N7-)-methyltransferase
MIDSKYWRRVQSFVRRDSRMTDAQQRVFNELWPRVGVTQDKELADFTQLFGRDAPRILEIGFGSGHSLLAIAKSHPEQDFIGIETYRPGIGTLLLGIESLGIENIRLYYADAVEVLAHCIPAASLDGVQLFFPDPWPKRRHHKRRIIQPEFVKVVTEKLKPGGVLHLATDWQDYAEQMMRVLSDAPNLNNLAGVGQFASRSSQRPVVTKFERRGEQDGRLIWELQFIRKT